MRVIFLVALFFAAPIFALNLAGIPLQRQQEILAAYAAQRSDGWSYLRQDLWPELCLTGKSQSPINIDVRTIFLLTFSS
jgi:carbonic anhydrase